VLWGVALTMVTATALVACGDEAADNGGAPPRALSADQRAIEAVLREQNGALSHGDFETYCGLMTNRLARRQATRPGETCVERMQELLSDAAAAASPDTFRMQIDGVRVGLGSRPDRARAFVRVGRGHQTLYLREQDGEWKLDRRWPDKG
jgi:hypothetical protein